MPANAAEILAHTRALIHHHRQLYAMQTALENLAGPGRTTKLRPRSRG